MNPKNSYVERVSPLRFITRLLITFMSLLPARLSSYVRFLASASFARSLSRQAASKANGLVLHGIFAGLHLPNLMRNDLLTPQLSFAQIFGFYEEELQKRFTAEGPYNLLLNAGADAGYYAIGFLTSKLAGASVAYEILEKSRRKLSTNATANEVELEIRGAFEADSIDEWFDSIHGSVAPSLILMDIEGAEFEVVNTTFLRKAAENNFHLAIELHGKLAGRSESEFKRRCQEFFFVEEIFQARSEAEFGKRTGLDLGEVDSAILMSAFRPFSQSWLYLKPLRSVNPNKSPRFVD